MNEDVMQYLSIGLLDPDPDQPRREMEAPDELNEARTLAGLSESIQRFGMLQPIRVRAGEGGRYVIVTGERRYQAAKMAGLEQVPVIVTSQQDILMEQLTENVQRKAMTPLELADAIQGLLKQGWAHAEISRQLGLNSSQVTILGKLQTVSAVVKDALETGVIVSPRAAYDLDKLPVRQQAQLVETARERGVVLGQGDVAAARKKHSIDVPAYQAPVLSAVDYAALMAILELPTENEETYDPEPNRRQIREGVQALQGDSRVGDWGNGDLGQQPPREEVPHLPQVPKPPQGSGGSEGIFEEAPPNRPQSDRSQEVYDWSDEIIKIPSFHLKYAELENLARVLGETLPEGLANPGGWLIEQLRAKAREIRRGRGRPRKE